MSNYSFEPQMSKLALDEILSSLDFLWPSGANSCVQLSDGEVVFLVLHAHEYNLLRYSHRSDASNMLSKIKADQFVFPEDLRPMILDVVATDWNIAISRFQIINKVLEKLSSDMSHDDGINIAIKKATDLRLQCNKSLNEIDVIIDPALKFQIPLKQISKISTGFMFTKFIRTQEAKFNAA